MSPARLGFPFLLFSSSSQVSSGLRSGHILQMRKLRLGGMHRLSTQVEGASSERRHVVLCTSLLQAQCPDFFNHTS